MILILRLISSYANWIYLFCAIGVLLCLSAIRGAIRERDASLFTLEREAATSRARRVLGLMVAVLLVAGATAFIDLSLVPRMDLSRETSVRTPLPLPTSTNILPPATPTPTVAQPSPTPTRPPRPTPTPAETPSPSPTPSLPPPTCPNPRVQITAPRPGAHLEGVVEIWGTVDMADFWYYKIEFAVGANPAETDWHWIGPKRDDAKERTINGYLVSWNTTGLSPGVYSLRLVVVDITGNYPPINICRLQVFI
ncbi:MAG: hypothetical protein ACE5LG_00925 [Anaerolineae bacterium]